MAVDFDTLVSKLRRLSPEELARVEALIARLEPGSVHPKEPFRAFSGVLSADDAALMELAVQDCERIDASGW